MIIKGRNWQPHIRAFIGLDGVNHKQTVNYASVAERQDYKEEDISQHLLYYDIAVVSV